MSTLQTDVDYLLAKLETGSPGSADQTQALAGFFSTFDGEVCSSLTGRRYTGCRWGC
jgi:hypothetical protein